MPSFRYDLWVGEVCGTSETIIGMQIFGASAPLKELTKKFGFTVEHIIEAAKKQFINT